MAFGCPPPPCLFEITSSSAGQIQKQTRAGVEVYAPVKGKAREGKTFPRSSPSMRPIFLPWAASALFLLGRVMASEEKELGEALQLQIINFNFETVKVTWNASEYSGTNLTFLLK
ncbi:hypothetical protein J1605_008328 [Eschrichtius robustus]|uniref:Cytokine receptor-like factor 2-like domain-containing protein n=1 Tax=Eschrichtius robustus TaxID=9764 RepID=A0AB34GW43_ESCRO|nr:hypothetical protein J1605_008328 [Eschrichtius robustus]